MEIHKHRHRLAHHTLTLWQQLQKLSLLAHRMQSVPLVQLQPRYHESMSFECAYTLAGTLLYMLAP